MFNILLVFAALLSFSSGIISNDPGSINLGLIILFVVLLSIVFNLLQERRAEQAIQSIRQLVPTNAKVTRSNQEKLVPVIELVPGDIIVLEEGDRVPADARVLSCFNLSVDNSALTGESEPQKRDLESKQGSIQEAVQCVNLVFAGTTILSGAGTAVVVSTGERTQFGNIVNLASTIREPQSPLQREIDRTARLNFVLAIIIGLIFLLIAYLVLHLALAASLLFMIGVMVSLVPEGFQITMTLSLALSSVAMAKRNVVVKRLSSVETLGSVTVICTDKTGTITEGQMTARWIWIGGELLKVTGEGYEPEGEVLLGDRRIPKDDRDLKTLAQGAALANTATLVPPLDRRKTRWTAIGDPTEAALLVMAAKYGVDQKEELARQKRIGLIPFASTRKMMTSVHEDARGRYIAYVKGASDEILARSVSAHWGKGKVVTLTEGIKAEILAQSDSFARDGYRVLAIAMRSLADRPASYESSAIEDQLTFVGLVALYDPPRAETTEAVVRAREAGIRIIMLTGDHELTARSIAQKVGIITSAEETVTTGSTLEAMSDEQLSSLLSARASVFARVTPAQKLRIVQSLKGMGEIVAVTGDGVNDTPALLEANIGIAMGITGTDTAKESADMVLMDDNFASIVNGVEQGRAVFDNLRKFVVYVFTHNWGELLAFIAFVLLQTPLPLAVIQVLAIDLLMEIPPSISLTVEPPEPGIMLRKPRSQSSRLFSIGALARSMYIGIIVGVFVLYWCFTVWSGAGWSLGSTTVPDHIVYLQGTTVVMVGIMAGQVGMLFATRTNVHSAFSVKLGRNKWVLRAMLVEMAILLALVYIPLLQGVFLTAGISPAYWLILFTIAPVVLLLEEVRKAVLRRVLKPEETAPSVDIVAGRSSSTPVSSAAHGFHESSPPVVVPLLDVPGHGNAILISAALCSYLGSRLIIAYDTGLEKDRLRHAELIAAGASAEGGVPVEFIRIERTEGERGQEVLRTLKEIEVRSGLGTVVLPVEHGVMVGKRRAIRKLRWLSAFMDKYIVIVDSSGRTESSLLTGSPRILIPILNKFHKEPFEIAQALSARTVFPDIDVVAAKIVEMPLSVPLYSLYRPDSLVNTKTEYSVIRYLAGEPLYRRLRPLVLLVRRADRDLTHFVRERKVDVVILGGDWHRHCEYVDKEQKKLASSAPALVIVTIPPAHGRSGRV